MSGTVDRVDLLPISILRRSSVFASYQAPVLHLLALFLILAAASLSMGSPLFFWQDARLIPLSALCAVQFVCALAIAQYLQRVPRTRFWSHNSLAVFLSAAGLLVILALTRWYYSRAFLLTYFSLETTWVFISAWAMSQGTKPRLGIVPGGVADTLLNLRRVEWLPVEGNTVPDVDGLVLDMHRPLSSEYVQMLAECCMRQVPVYHAALIQELLTGRISLDHLSRGMVEGLTVSIFYRAAKRAMDLFLVLIALPIALPLIVVTAIIVCIDSPGPILFRQRRVGRGGATFEMVKFRTMRYDPAATAQFAKKNDTRITRWGSLLRAYRLDELPQLWNIFKGEMSFIGPRPEQVEFVKKFTDTIPFYASRHLIKPGLSGWAQVHHGYADSEQSTQDKLEYDLFYVKNASVSLDLVIILQTIRTVLTRFGSR